MVNVEFAVAATNCTSQQAKDNLEACQLLPEDQSVSMPAHQSTSLQLRGRTEACCDALVLAQE